MVLADVVAERMGSLSPTEQRVARFLAAEAHRVGYLSASRIGQEVGASDATVIRTVRALGFAGLDDLREAVADELSPQGRLAATLRPATGRDDVLAELVQRRTADVAALCDRVGLDAMSDAVRVLGRARRLVFVGFGPSGFLASYGAHQARRLGIEATTVAVTGSDLADALLDVRRTDAFVVLAYAPLGGAVEVVLAEAQAAGSAVVLVTDGASRPTDEVAVVLPVGRGDPTQIASHAATIVAVESLVLAVASRGAARAEAASARLRELRASVAARSGRAGR